MRSASGRCWALALAALACSESTVPAGPARHLTLVSGGGQRGLATDVLAERIAIRVVDDAGLPMIGLPVAWTSPDEGYFIPGTDLTDAQGIARTQWVLGVRSGPQSAIATVHGWDDRLAVEATALPGLKAVSLMGGDPPYHMCAIAADGSTWCWSWRYGEKPALQSPMGNLRFRSLTGGYATSCGLTEADELWCWSNAWEAEYDTVAAIRIRADLRFRSVDTEYPMTCAVTVTNDGYCWGTGVLGDGQPVRTSPDPVLVTGGHAWQEIAASRTGACGTTVRGETFCWTDSLHALQLMGLQGPGPFLTPTPVPMIRNLRSLTTNDHEQCGLIIGGTSTLCWGWQGYREPDISVPFDPVPSVTFHKLSAAYLRSAGLDSRGTIWAWRKDFDSFHGDFVEPTPMIPQRVWRDVAATGGMLFGILAADSTVHAWSSRYHTAPDSKAPEFSTVPSSSRYPSAIRVSAPPP
jgi:hypothetical protein